MLRGMLLAVLRLPARPDAIHEAARLSGMAVPDVSRRLTGALPRVLLSDASGERVTALAGAFEEAGFAVLSCDPAAVPGDDDRVVARRLELHPGEALVAFDSTGAEHRCPLGAARLIQRGTRNNVTTEMVTEKKKQLALGKAVLTGGLAISKTVETRTMKITESSERFLLLHRSGDLGASSDGRDVIIYERRIDYRVLGAEMQTSSAANLDKLTIMLRALLPGVPLDDRVARPGFIAGLPLTTADPTDLALFLVHLDHLAG